MDNLEKDKINTSEPPVTIEHPASKISDNAWKIAEIRYAVIEPLSKLPEIQKVQVEAACQELKIGRSRFYRRNAFTSSSSIIWRRW